MLKLLFAVIAGAAGLYLAGFAPAPVYRAVDALAETAGLRTPAPGSATPDKLGWMDDAPLTETDRGRIAAIRQRGNGSTLTRRDFELLRQDRRSARAAYPELDTETLFESAWFYAELGARIPRDWITSYNGNFRLGPDGQWYADGPIYLTYVKRDYPNRATAAETKAFFEALKAKRQAQ